MIDVYFNFVGTMVTLSSKATTEIKGYSSSFSTNILKVKNHATASLLYLEHYALFCRYIDHEKLDLAFRDYINNGKYDNDLRRKTYKKSSCLESFCPDILSPKAYHESFLADAYHRTNWRTRMLDFMISQKFVQDLYALENHESVFNVVLEMESILKGMFNNESVSFERYEIIELQRTIQLVKEGSKPISASIRYAIYPQFVSNKPLSTRTANDYSLVIMYDFRRLVLGNAPSDASTERYFFYPRCHTSERLLQESFYDKCANRLSLTDAKLKNTNDYDKERAYRQDDKSAIIYSRISSLVRCKRNEYVFNIERSEHVHLFLGVDPARPLISQKNVIIISNYEYQIIVTSSVTFETLLGEEKHIRRMVLECHPKHYEKALSKIGEGSKIYNNPQREIMFGIKHNLTIGRSGTGKTEAILMEILDREVSANRIKTAMSAHKKVTATKDNLSQESGLKTIYIAASSFLANEVRARYNLMREDFLDNYDTKGTRESTTSIPSEIDILKSIGNRSERQQSLPTSFASGSKQSYPLFMTFREFILILYKTVMNQLEDDCIANSSSFLASLTGILAKTASIISNMSQSEKNAADKAGLMYSLISKREVTYEVFKREFWDIVVKRDSNMKIGISSIEFWTTLLSAYKGNPATYEKTGNKLNRKFTVKILNSISELEIAEMNKIGIHQDDIRKKVNFFTLAEKYEDWKNRNDMFDIEDIVGEIFNFTSMIGGPIMFHYIMIDEIQDISLNSLDLVNNFCSIRYVLCGDNAQNIDRGLSIGFNNISKFLEEKLSTRKRYINYSLFKKVVSELTSIHSDMLTVNYRSTNQILEFGNLMISLLETWFREEIDVLPKETGPRNGPKPQFVAYGQKSDILLDIYSKRMKCDVEIDDQGTAKLLPRNNFCVIVRNQSEKEKVPLFMEGLLILTLKECKGLEFEHVLLYNFFSSSSVKKMWTSLFKCT